MKKSGSLLVFCMCIMTIKCVDSKNQAADNLLLNAIQAGNIAQVNEALNSGADINTFTKINKRKAATDMEDKDTSIDDKDIDILGIYVSFLFLEAFDKDGRPDEEKKEIEEQALEFVGGTALALATLKGNMGIVKLLLDKGANVNAQNNRGETALMFAPLKGNMDIATLLLDRDANVNAQNSQGRTALMLATFMGNIDMVKLLLNKGANVNAVDKEDETALSFYAHMRPKTEIVQLLRKALENPQPSTQQNKFTELRKRLSNAREQFALPTNFSQKIEELKARMAERRKNMNFDDLAQKRALMRQQALAVRQ